MMSYAFVESSQIESIIMNNTKQIEWRHAFMEWHRHRTDLTAAQEIKARQELLVSIREQRRK